ncbi:MAG: hypothetical protein OXI44_04175 [Bacteroidota bacterium]|nr:hypothetical protein [Bacteroidota bacterium]
MLAYDLNLIFGKANALQDRRKTSQFRKLDDSELTLAVWYMLFDRKLSLMRLSSEPEATHGFSPQVVLEGNSTFEFIHAKRDYRWFKVSEFKSIHIAHNLPLERPQCQQVGLCTCARPPAL